MRYSEGSLSSFIPSVEIKYFAVWFKDSLGAALLHLTGVSRWFGGLSKAAIGMLVEEWLNLTRAAHSLPLSKFREGWKGKVNT